MEATAPRLRIPSPGEKVQHALAALAYLALSLFYMRPIARVLGSHIAPDPGDTWFNLTVLEWGMHQIRQGMPDFWNMPFFFPSRGVTTYSDHLLGPAAVGTLWTALFPDSGPAAVYNLFFLSSFVLCAWGTWYVLRRSGTGAVASFLGGCMFAFSPFRWDQLSHVQILLMGWIPLTLWTWDRLLEAPSWRRAALFFACFVLHVTGGTYLAYMMLFPLAILLAIRAPRLLGRDRLRSTLRVLLPTGVACALLLGALFLPYLRAAGSRTRSALEIQVYGASLASYVTPTDLNLYAGPAVQPWQRPENALFAGILPSLLLLAAAARGGWARRQTPLRPLSRARRMVLVVLVLLAVAGVVIAERATWSLFFMEDLPARGLDDFELASYGIGLGFAALGLRRLWGGNWPLRLADLTPWERGLLLSGLLAFLLTFPAVYQPLMRWIPGLSGMRVAARFYAYASFAIAWFAARELDRWLRRPVSRGWRTAAASCAVALLLIDLAPRPLNWVPTPGKGDFPPVYRWLARQDDVAAVLEIPFWSNSTEISYMVYATLHWKPLVNGYSGYLPDVYLRFREACCWPVPNEAQLAMLRDQGVSHILLHGSALTGDWSWQILNTFEKQEGVSLLYDDGGDRVYRILPGG